MDLKEWTLLYIKNKDLMKKDLLGIDEKEDSIECRYKAFLEVVYIRDTLEDEILKKLEAGNIMVSCLNSKTNVNFLGKNWERLIINPDLKIIFANPITNDKWIIRPRIHDKITEKGSLKKGLVSLFESIPPA